MTLSVKSINKLDKLIIYFYSFMNKKKKWNEHFHNCVLTFFIN